MIDVSLSVRRAEATDHQQITSLLFHEANVHRHLDWRSPLDWLGADHFWVLQDGHRILAAMACPEDPPQVAWIRIFSYLPQLTGHDAWRVLWEAACADLAQRETMQVAVIVLKQWFRTILENSGFVSKQTIVTLELRGEYFVKSFPIPPGVRIRPMQEQDLPAVVEMDLEAFGPFWHNTADSLSRARTQAVYASVAESSSGLIGYQISTGNPFGAHLARLAVSRKEQNQGLGAALVSDLIQQLTQTHLSYLTVNTQADNAASLSLYRKLGFVQTGEHFPVLVHPMGRG